MRKLSISLFLVAIVLIAYYLMRYKIIHPDFKSPNLNGRVSSTSILKHIKSANYLDNEEVVCLTGTRNSSGIGEGFVESVSLRSKTGMTLAKGLSNSTTSTILLPEKVVLIANYRKYLALNLRDNTTSQSMGAPE